MPLPARELNKKLTLDEDAFIEYGDKVLDVTDNDFGYELVQFGQYIILTSGFYG
ncbi:hypothetical protein OAV62_01560 [bacterium]|nr:hypothetical protein [bacterium]